MTRKEMIPVPEGGFCKPEWDLLCWIHREIGLVKGADNKSTMFKLLVHILDTMDKRFDNWPEDPK